MKTFNIQPDRQPISPEEINARKKFNSLLKQYQTKVNVSKPAYKTTIVKGVAVLTTITVITTVSVWSYRSNSHAEKTSAQSRTEQVSVKKPEQVKKPVKKSVVAPPIKGVTVKRNAYTINASKGGTVRHNTGTKLVFPKNAFADKNGKDVNGDVEIKYREFHDLADIIVSGIPMRYDSAGKMYHFESAGMMEVLGFKGDEQVFIKPGKNVLVHMASANGESRFNLYSLDTVSGKWEYKGKDKVTRNADNTRAFGDRSENKITKELFDKEAGMTGVDSEKLEIQNSSASAAPVKPRKAGSSKYRFDIDFDKTEFPELGNFDGLQFEVDEKQEKFNPSVFKVEWEDIELLQANKSGDTYRVRVKKGKHSAEFDAYPVVEGKNYSHAMDEYAKKFDAYKKEVEKRKEKDRLKKEELEAKLALYKKERAKVLEKENQTDLAEIGYGNSSLTYLRVFQISGFGIWNCDNPLRYPTGRNIMARFVDEKGNQVRIPNNLYLVEDGRNAIFSFPAPAGNIKEFRYDPKKENMVWGINENGELITLERKELNAVPGNAKEYTFNMKKCDAELKTVGDVRKYFGLIKDEKS